MIKEIDGYCDGRADRFFDLFDFLPGQVTASVIHPNQFSGWHKHKLQQDYFCVVKGELDVYVVDTLGHLTVTTLSSDKPAVLEINPNEIHSWHSKSFDSVLIYYLTRKHDESDEFRLSFDEVMSICLPTQRSKLIELASQIENPKL